MVSLTALTACAVGVAGSTETTETSADALTLREIFQKAPTPFCWTPTTARGRGQAPAACDAAFEQQGSQCYAACEAGFVKQGNVCVQTCPDGFTDLGRSCQRAASVVPVDLSACTNQDKCSLASTRCSVCPSGYEKVGCSCRRAAESFVKERHDREAIARSCPAGLVLDGGRCFTPCEAGEEGAGPWCKRECPAAFPAACGAGCAVSADACALTIADQALAAVEVVTNIAAALAAKPNDAPTGATPVELTAEQRTALHELIVNLLHAAEPSLTQETLDQLAEELVSAAETGSMDLGELDLTELKAVFEVFLFPVCKDGLVPAEG